VEADDRGGGAGDVADGRGELKGRDKGTGFVLEWLPEVPNVEIQQHEMVPLVQVVNRLADCRMHSQLVSIGSHHQVRFVIGLPGIDDGRISLQFNRATAFSDISAHMLRSHRV